MGLFDQVRKLLGAGKSAQDARPSATITGLQAEGQSAQSINHDAVLQATHDRLDAYWAGIGSAEPDVLTHLISPSFMGGPHWPTTRQAYRVIRRGSSTILATDGMSDPFDDGEDTGNGFEMELFIETADLPLDFLGDKGDLSPIMKSWAFELLKHVAAIVADAGGITEKLNTYGVLSIEFPGVSLSNAVAAQVPKQFVAADDSLGILLGGPDPDFPTRIEDMPLSPVRIVPIVLITAAELDRIRFGGRTGRDELVAKLATSPSRHRSNFNRPGFA
jgi:hypothetical protein